MAKRISCKGSETKTLFPIVLPHRPLNVIFYSRLVERVGHNLTQQVSLASWFKKTRKISTENSCLNLFRLSRIFWTSYQIMLMPKQRMATLIPKRNQSSLSNQLSFIEDFQPILHTTSWIPIVSQISLSVNLQILSLELCKNMSVFWNRKG